VATIIDYASLKQAVSDFTHRGDLATGNYIDYFIQAGQERLTKDIFEANFGNGIQLMEQAYGPYPISAGVLQVPSGWLAPKLMTVADGSSQQFTLIFKAAAWLYDNYPLRQPQGLPAYIARDVQPATTFTGVMSGTTLTVSAITTPNLVVGTVIDDAGGNVAFNTVITAFGSGSGGNGTYTINNSQSVSSEPMTGGGNVFVFGPYADSSYSVSGTFYAQAALLSGSSTTNWMVLSAPNTLLQACMVEAGKFLLDDVMIARWNTPYQDSVKTLVDRDKAERWASSTMQIELG